MNVSSAQQIVVVGAGAAGCFGAIRAAEGGLPVIILEEGRVPLRKVRVSGGGRCNLTHACFDPAVLVRNYPRGHKELLGPFYRFQPRDTIEWFRQRGVETKTEADGRMFPVTDESSTVIDCLLSELKRLRVPILMGHSVRAIRRGPEGTLELETGAGERLQPEACLLAAGSLGRSALPESLEQLGHTIADPVPSLFTFRLAGPDLKDLAGVSVPEATTMLAGSGLSQSGPILVTHAGLSGPAVLKLSAWGAREMHAAGYCCTIKVQWLPGDRQALRQQLDTLRQSHPKKRLDTWGLPAIPKRLWQRLVQLAGGGSFIWSQLPAAQRDRLLDLLCGHELEVDGKSTNKEEFVTCGGVSLPDVNFRTMESRHCPGLYLAGETLDIDGVTGGFNFQAAWTTGHIAGSAIAATVAK